MFLAGNWGTDGHKSQAGHSGVRSRAEGKGKAVTGINKTAVEQYKGPKWGMGTTCWCPLQPKKPFLECQMLNLSPVMRGREPSFLPHLNRGFGSIMVFPLFSL